MSDNNEVQTLDPEQEASGLEEQKKIRIEHRQALIDAGFAPYGQAFDSSHTAEQALKEFAEIESGQEGGKVIVAGRVTAQRSHGKASFMDLTDRTGRLQLYFRQNALGDENYQLLDNIDLGDTIGVTGTMFRTRRGELSVKIEQWTILSKALIPPPEKWHGLKDVEIRYRQRYADLLSNEEVRNNFILRSKIVSALRNFLDEKGFLEVETPVMSTLAGGASARPFKTHHNALDMQLYLRIATELYLKRCIVGGLERVYEVGRTFRNEGVSTRHNPEFTMMELYQAYADYEDMMDLTQELIQHLCQKVLKSYKTTFLGHEIDLEPDFQRISMDELFQKHLGRSIHELRDPKILFALADELKLGLTPKNTTVAHAIDKIFDHSIQHHLVQPTFVTDYPIELSPLAKRKAEDPQLTDRFELFVAGTEIANAFSELNDPEDQRQRFEDQQANKEIDDEAHPIDEDYINALEYGMPPTGGLGIGIDRLVMVLTSQDSIRDVILFPLMRPRAQ